MFMKFGNSVDVRVTRHTLVAAFSKSDPPLIWKFDLERNHSFTLALQGEEGELELGATSPKGEFYSIARFTDREAAEEAFFELQKTLIKKRRVWLWTVLSVLGLLDIVVLAAFLAGWLVVTLYGGHVSMPSVPKIRPGVAVPADQVLQPPPLPGASAVPGMPAMPQAPTAKPPSQYP